MLTTGSVAVALVKNQVMVVQAARTHTKKDKYLHVRTYTAFGEGLFLASDIPDARIPPSDLLAVLPPLEDTSILGQDMLELPSKSFSQYLEHARRHQMRYEDLWNAWVSKKR